MVMRWNIYGICQPAVEHFEAAIRVIEQANAHSSGRLSGILAPDTLDTTAEDLLRDTLALAAERELAAHNPLRREHGGVP